MKDLRLVVFWLLAVMAILPNLVQLFSLRWSDVTYSYGWLIWVTIVLGIALIGWRWDRQLKWPADLLPQCSLVAAGVAAVLGAVVNAIALSSLMLPLVAYSFLASHRSKPGRLPLITAWPCFAVVLTLPAAWEASLSETLRAGVVAATDSLLTLFRVPHAVYGEYIALVDRGYFVLETTTAWNAWPFWVALALLHAAWFGRSPVSLVLNIASAIVTSAIFHVMELSGQIIAVETYGQTTSAAAMTTTIITWIVCLVIFLSLDRLFQSLAFPIDSKFTSSQSNPLILLWNRCQVHRKSARPRRVGANMLWDVPAAVAVLLLCGGACWSASKLAARETETVGRAAIQWQPQRNLFAGLLDEDTVDFSSVELARGSANSRVQHTWIDLNETCPTEITIGSGRISASRLIDRIQASRWRDSKSPSEFDSLEDGILSGTLTSKNDARQLYWLIGYLKVSDGQLAADSIADDQVMSVQMTREPLPGEETYSLASAEEEFKSVLSRVGSALRAQP